MKDIQAEAAVAVVRTVGDSPALLILRRAINPKDPWSGHFSLPGGRRESQDLDLLDTCMREAREECGLLLTRENLLRPLPSLVAGNALGKPSRVAPFLFELPSRPPLVLEALEIAEYHWVTEEYLMDFKNHGVAAMLPGREHQLFPGLRLGDSYVWGFTYRVLSQLLGFKEN